MKRKHHAPLRIALGLAAVCLSLLALRRFLADEQVRDATVFLYARVSLLLQAAVILAASLSIGLAVLRWTRLRPGRAGAAALFAVGLGLGITSIATLALGTAGLCNPFLLLAVFLIFILLGFRDLVRLIRVSPGALARLRRASAYRIALWAVLFLFLVLNLVRSFMPPHEYDSLEYHLAAPAAYHDAGRVRFLSGNVYSNFPENAEMLTFLAMRLADSRDSGAIVGQLLHTAMGFFAALALYGMLRGLAGKETGLAAAAIFYTWPGVTIYSGNHYVELPLIFYATLAAWAAAWSILRKRSAPGARRWVTLSAAAAGLALGVKYTAALLVVLPLAAWLLFTVIKPRIPSGEVARRTALFAGVVVLCFLPWMIRNYVNTRNPVYPLLYSVFGSSNWDPVKDARWTRAHSPRLLAARDMIEQAKDVLFFNRRMPAMLLVIFIPFCLLVRRRTRAFTVALGAHAALLFLLYYFFTQHNSRFLDVWIPLLAALSAVGLGSALRLRHTGALRPALILLLLFAPARAVNYFHVWMASGVAAGAETPDLALRRLSAAGGGNGAQYKRLWLLGFGPYANMQFINDEKNVPRGSRVLFVGEARTFYCMRDHVAATVFDTQPIEEIVGGAQSVEEVFERFRAAGVTHIYVNTFELCRLQNSYRFSYDGRERLGMLDGFDWPLFGRFARDHLRIVKTFAGPDPASFPWEQWERFRRSWAGKRPVFPHFTALYEIR